MRLPSHLNAGALAERSERGIPIRASCWVLSELMSYSFRELNSVRWYSHAVCETPTVQLNASGGVGCGDPGRPTSGVLEFVGGVLVDKALQIGLRSTIRWRNRGSLVRVFLSAPLASVGVLHREGLRLAGFRAGRLSDWEAFGRRSGEPDVCNFCCSSFQHAYTPSQISSTFS